MTTPLTDEQRADFAEYGCGGVGEYSRCHDMSEDYAALLNLLAAERERADREKARADALEHVIAKVRALFPPVRYATWDHDRQYPIRGEVRAADLAALLPDDTKEADRG